MPIYRLAAIALLVAASCGDAGSQSSNNPHVNLTVYAASTLQPVFDKVAAKLKAENITTTFTYADSGTLATQLVQGATADVFASADAEHMRTLEDAGFLADEAKVFAYNRLEIVVKHGNPKGVHSLADLTRSGLVVVLAEPSTPAGEDAQVVLGKAGIKLQPASLEPQVGGVLTKVAQGDADAGIVYHTDVVASGKVDGVEIPDAQNIFAEYSIGRLFLSQYGEAGDTFIAYVLSSSGRSLLKSAGFAGA